MATSRGTVRLHLWAVEAAKHQGGVVARRQLLSWGWTSEEIQGQVRAKRWRRLHRGVYWTATGPPSREAALWAAVLASGDCGVLWGASAAEAWGFGLACDPIRVAVPRGCKPRSRLVGVVVARDTSIAERVDSAAMPPRTTVEDTVLDLVEQAGRDSTALGWITRALQSRHTTPERVLVASAGRARLRRRALVEATCGHHADGATTPLEIGWVSKVERPHGLPRALRQARGTVRGRTVYRDLAYGEFGVYVELDGRLGHEGAEHAFRDMRRDNAAAEQGRTTLRYGWFDTMSHACDVAAQVGAVLAARGWSGSLTACAEGCTAA